MNVRIRSMVVDRALGNTAEDNEFLEEYNGLGWTLAAAIILSKGGYQSTYTRFYFTRQIVEEE